MSARPTTALDGYGRHDLAAERYVLGAVLLEPSLLPDVLARCAPADLYSPAAATILAAMAAVAARGAPVDVLTLASELRAHERLETVGGHAALDALTDACTTAHALTHAARLGDLAACRRVAAAGHAIVARAADHAVDAAAAVAYAQAAVMDVARGGGPRRDRAALALHDVLERVFGELDDARAAGAALGLRTGFAALDALLGGVPPGDYVLVGGRPSQGKTALALAVAANASAAGVPTLVYSLEMSAAKLGRRLLASAAGVSSQRLRSGQLTQADMDALATSAQRLCGHPLWIDDLGALTPAALASATRRHVHAHGPVGLVVVDYVQLMDAAPAVENVEKEIREASRAIKALAIAQRCVVLVVAQLSRKCEERADKRPVLSDLRDSGSLEQDADAVLFVYRDEYYTRERSRAPGEAEVIVAKQRDGPTGTARLAFDRHLSRFGDLTTPATPTHAGHWLAEYDAEGAP